jgi:hypothetical protein
MQQARALAAAITLAAAAALFSGCGSSLATVSGEVTYDGKPVGDGYITFTPTDGKGNDAGGPISAGSYKVTGVPPGPKVVKVMAVKKVNFAASSEEMMQRAAEARKTGNHDGLVDPADTIPDNAEGNNAQLEVRPGEQVHNFALKAPAKGKR